MGAYDILIDGVTSYTKYATSKRPDPKQGQSWLDTLQEWRENPNLQSDYKVATPKRDLVENKHYFSPPFTQTPFKNALSTKQPTTTETAYNEAVANLKSLMNELTTLAINEQGTKSELGYLLDINELGFSLISEGESQRLEFIKKQVKNNGDKDAIVNAIEGYFMFGETILTYALNFFDYASDKFEGLPMEQIMQDLSTIKGWWDNNSKERLTLDDGTKIGFTQSFDNNGNVTYTTLFITLPNGVEIKFDEVNLESKNSQILFEMFKQRENLQSKDEKSNKVNLNENSKTNLSLNNTNLNRNANTINSHLNLNEFFNTKTNSNKYSNDSLLKALLQGVSSDENSLKDLKA